MEALKATSRILENLRALLDLGQFPGKFARELAEAMALVEQQCEQVKKDLDEKEKPARVGDVDAD